MKIRIKFRKYGEMKFIGHLDMMRYFQKAMRRAGIDIRYSEGFSPHMIMSFASPLGVGLTSDGEYLDIEVGEPLSSREAAARLNEVMVDGVEVVSFRRIPDGKASNAMALTAAADYEVRFREGMEPEKGWESLFDAFCAQSRIPVVKKTKKGEQELDIRPLLYRSERREDHIFLQLAAGSAENLKPELVMDAFGAFAGITISEHALLIHRLELYADTGMDGERRLVSLESLGERVE
ncbi:MAG: DUF2344 domain-containing protein [Lachnospiraceae bacterium]|jgi:radical SAM-linked protein|nr:DUF2344 domain-containing protein [Lachnospiraceae bacterium]